MRHATRCLAILLLFSCSGGVFGQDTGKPKAPFSVEPSTLKMKFKGLDKVPSRIKAAIAQQAASATQAGSQSQLSLQNSNMMPTIPHWSGSFTYQGTKYPYVMAGGPPAAGGTTRIGTQLIPLKFMLDGCADANGNPVKFGVKSVLFKTLNSPDFEETDYETGYSQFSDAVQRAN